MRGKFISPLLLFICTILITLGGCATSEYTQKDFHFSIVDGRLVDPPVENIEPFVNYSGSMTIVNQDQSNYRGHLYVGELASFEIDTMKSGYAHYPRYRSLENPLYFAIDIGPNESLTYRYQIYHYNSYNVPYSFEVEILPQDRYSVEVEEYRDTTKKQIILYAFILGLLFAFLFYAVINLYIYRESYFKFYIVYVAGSILYSLLEDERHLEFNILFSNNPDLFILLYSIFNLVSIIAYINFFTRFLDLKHREVFLHRIIVVLTIVLSGSVVIDLILNLNGYYVLAFYQSLGCRLSALFLGIYSIIILTRRKDKITNLILMGTMIWLISTLAYTMIGILKSRGVLSFDYYFNPHLILQVGTLLELTLFNIAINARQQQIFIRNEAAKAASELETQSLKHQRLLEKKEADRLKELDAVKTELYTNITHEFRTPLTVIMGLADEVEDTQKAGKMIKRNAASLLDLVNQILDLNKLDDGHLELEYTQVDLVLYVRSLSEMFDRWSKLEGRHFQIKTEEESFWMDVDTTRFEHIISNLVHNAVKNTSTDGNICLRLSRIEAGKVCRISVEDDGHGIPTEDLDRIFDRYYQVERSRQSTQGGSGIGLSLVKGLVEKMGGNISLKSQEGVGSTFTVDLPIRQVAPINSITIKEKSKVENSRSVNDGDVNRPTILVVEDHHDVRHFIAQLLGKAYRILHATDGHDGLRQATSAIPDLIISDIRMPKMDGYKMCQELKNDKRTSHIPIILLTAKSSQTDKLEGLKEGADAYIIKPFDKKELFIRIENLLESRVRLRDYYQQHQMLPTDLKVENEFLVEVRNHIENNFGNEEYQIEDLAHAMYLSRTQIYRKLKALTGKSFTEHVRDMKMKRATTLLQNSGKSIAEIAFLLGYRDTSYFTKVFKRHIGITPSEARKNQEG